MSAMVGQINAASKGFSAPASVGSDIATVTGLPEYASEAAPIQQSRGIKAVTTAGAASTAYQCSQY